MDFDKYNILLTVNNIYFKQALVTMMSAILNCNKNCNFYILNSNWSNRQKNECTEFVSLYPGNQVEIIDVDEEPFKFFNSFKNTYCSYFKLLANQYLPNSVNRVLYVDPDVIFRKDIETLYSMDFEDNYFIAVNSLAELSITAKNSDWFKMGKLERSLRINTNSNPGVLYINTDKMRNENIDIDFYKDQVAKLPDDYWFDEGILNYIFADKRKYVPAYKYGTMLGFINNYRNAFKLNQEERRNKLNEDYSDEFDEKEELTLLHFVCSKTRGKPWDCYYDRLNDNIINPNGNKANTLEEPYYKEWWNIARKLPLPIYEELLVEAEKNQIKQLNNRLTWSTNAMNFFERLSYDCVTNLQFLTYMKKLENTNLSILKSNDAVGKFLTDCTKLFDIKIIFSTQKARLSDLTPDEWENCKKADNIICCCVHGTLPVERDRIKPIMIKDMLKNDSSLQNENQLNSKKCNNNLSDKIDELSSKLDITSIMLQILNQVKDINKQITK